MRTLAIIMASLLAGFALSHFLFPRSGAVQANVLGPPNIKKSINLSLADGGIYRVRSVIDGDTVVLENGLHVRYNGVNTPETGRWVKDYSPMSREATAKNIELVEGKKVRLRFASDPIDMYGRVVANLSVVSDDPAQPDIEVREVLLKGGYGKVMGLGVASEEYHTLKAWQDEAKASGAGIWGIPKEAPSSAVPAEEKPFRAASSSKIYHSATCAQARRISPANLHEYATAEDAESLGLKPCTHCLGKK